MKDDIFFLDFVFNKRFRTLYHLRHTENIIQLRKKESDVLGLLCDRHPHPVSQDDFLRVIWGGRYVCTQSIAQIIRRLRVILNDENRNIIMTISKLGYKLNTSCYFNHYEKPMFADNETLQYKLENGKYTYAFSPEIYIASSCKNTNMIVASLLTKKEL